MSRSIPRRAWLGYAVALAAVAAAVAMRAMLLRAESRVAFITFIPAVIVAALYGGRGPGLLATLLSGLAASFFLEPVGKPIISRAADEAGFWLFLAIGLFIVWLCERARRANCRADEAAVAQARLAAIVESSDDAIIGKALDGTIQTWNAAASRLFGYAADEVIGRPIHLLVPADRQAEEDDILGRLRRGERVEHFETVRLRKDGTAVEVSVTVSPVRGADGRIVGASKISRDITEPRRAQRQLQAAKDVADASAAQWRAVVGSMTEGVVIADPSGNLPEWNAAALEMHGFASVAEIGRRLAEFPDILELSTADGQVIPLADWPTSRVLRGETFSRHEVHIRRLDADLRRVISYGGSPVPDRDGGVALAVLTLHDVTEERRAQAALREREERLRAIFEQSTAGIAQLDLDGRFVLVNQWMCGLLGYAEAELLATNVRDITHPDDWPRNRDVMERSKAGGPDYRIEKRYLRKDGSTLWVNVSSSIVRDEAGRPTGVLGVITDMTERKRAEERLARHALLLAHVGDSVIVTDLAGVITFWNEGATRLFGWTASEMIGRPYADRLPEPSRSEVAAWIGRIAAGGDEFQGEWLDHRKDGSTLWIEAATRRILDPGGVPVGIMGVSRDVSDRVRAAAERERLLVEGRAQLARTEEILESISDAFYAVDANFRFTYVNRRAEEMLGRRRADLIGRAYAAEFPEAVDGEAYRTHRRAMADRAPARYETIAARMGRWIEGALYPDANGGLSCYFRDIGDRKRAETALRESEERLQLAVSIAQMGTFLIDLRNDAVTVNDAGRAMYGWAADEPLTFAKVQSHFHPDDRD